MKSEFPKKLRKKKIWIPRVPILLPPGKVMKSKKDYDRKKEKSVERWM